MRILEWDIELAPMTVYSWSLWPNFIPIQQIQQPQEMLCYGARWRGEKKVHFQSVHHDGKQAMLEGLWNLLDEADALVSWNGAGFDTKHVRTFFLLEGMTPPSPAKEIDLMRAVKSQMKFASNKLDWVSQQLGIGKKVPHEGFQLWLDCMAGDEKAWAKMKKYQIQDVNLLDEAYTKLLPWIPNHPSVPLHDGTFDGCPNCGSEKYQRRGYSHTGAGRYARFQCTSCGKWFRGKSLIAASEHRHAT